MVYLKADYVIQNCADAKTRKTQNYNIKNLYKQLDSNN